jgi:hypothetical protein
MVPLLAQSSTSACRLCAGRCRSGTRRQEPVQRAQDEDRTCSDGNADHRIRVEQQGAYPRTDARPQCAYEVTAIVVFQRPEEGTAVAAYALDFALHLGDRTRAARSTATAATRRRPAQSDAHNGARHSLTDPQLLLAQAALLGRDAPLPVPGEGIRENPSRARRAGGWETRDLSPL